MIPAAVAALDFAAEQQSERDKRLSSILWVGKQHIYSFKPPWYNSVSCKTQPVL